MAISRPPATSSLRAIALWGALLSIAPSCRSQPPGDAPSPPGASDPAPPASDPPRDRSDADGATATAPRAAPADGADGWAEAEVAPEDAPLPAPDEIPAFLAPAGGAVAPSGEPASSAGKSAPRTAAPDDDRAPRSAASDGDRASPPGGAASTPARAGPRDESLEALMRQVRIEEEGSEEEGSFASIVDADPPASPDRGGPADDEAAGALRSARGEPARETEPAGETARCADLVARIDARMDYLRRVAAERDSFAYVEDEADANALRLLAAMRRCVEHPDDEDCRAPPMEVELRDVEPPRHQFEVWPTDLEAEHRDPDEVPQDPGIRELLHQLEACRRRHTPQPLLDRHRGG
ncbi:MAG TPA: hypothetical protein VN033_11450 [Vulgatibacter sp.]|nr:hypothetical protein [Vulgatibacter sp.]